MGLFGCTHEWKITDKTFHPPLKRAMTFDDAESKPARMATFGYTTVSYKCKICGQIETNHLVGEYKE